MIYIKISYPLSNRFAAGIDRLMIALEETEPWKREK